MSESDIRAALPAIAIIGMAGRFPGARDLDAFWRNLRDGVESISFFSAEELEAQGVPPEVTRHPAFVKARGVLEDPELFDAAFFDVPPRQAELMDPQHRNFLECAWHALEDAGCDPERFPGPIGVYGGVTFSTYFLANLLSNPHLIASAGTYQIAIGTDRDYLTTLVSYKLDLKGPSLDVQTACSTSLVAVALACQGLLSYQCDAALAGGVSIKFPQVSGYMYQPGGLDSSDGRCRAFDARADGSVYGSGVGVVVLKRLEDALADGDAIRAVVLGSTMNNDGAGKVGFTAPGVAGQADAIATAQALAGVAPETIGYVECHGSGTALGDPIEVAALTKAFRAGGLGADRVGVCPIGSVKASIGHCSAAAGAAGLIKAVLALEHRQIPPSLHFEHPNPAIDFAASPFYVNARLAEWRANGTPRRAGVSSFGLGGTNAHVVLEEAPEQAPSGPSRPWQLLLLSARTETALEAATDALAAHLAARPEEELPDIAHTLQAGRRAFAHRRALVARDAAEAARALAGRDPVRLLSGVAETAGRPVAFLFSGLGDHYPDMARGLYDLEPAFRAEVDRCAELLARCLGGDVREVLFTGERRIEEGAGPDLRRMLGRAAAAISPAAPRPLDRTLWAQPALFTVEVALARLWMEWGVRPEAVLGYSLGEYAAAHVAGVLSLEDALLLVAERARLIEGLPPGAMLAVPLSEARVTPLLGGVLDLAATNGPEVLVVAGPVEEVEALERRLAVEGIPCRRLPTTHAFHSRMMEPAAAALTALAGRVRLAPPAIPLVSNVTGTWLTPGEATDPAYWARHLRQPVRFAEGLATAARNPARVLLEVGPGQGLTTIALQQAMGAPREETGAGPERVALPSLPHAWDPQPDGAFVLGALGKLWLAGVRVDWAGYRDGERRRKVRLPLYPFERRRYWIEPGRLEAPVARQEPAEVAPPAAAGGPAPRAPGLHARPALRNAYVAPEDELEERIAAVWQELLGVAPIGAHDSFFELGGHSLLGTSLLLRLRDLFAVELPLAVLFETPTVAGLAAAVAAGLGAATVSPSIVPVPRDRELPLSYAQQRLWFLDQLEPGNPFYNLSMAVRLSGSLDVPVLARALAEVARRHESLRTVFVRQGDEPLQVVLPSAPLPLPLADLVVLPEAAREREARRLVRLAAREPFDLARGPVMRARLVSLGPADHVFACAMHHIVSDFISLTVLVREMTTFYLAFSRGERAALPEPPIQYADFAVWQREWLAGEVLASELAFWRERLAGAPAVVDLPFDRPRPLRATFRGASRGVALPAALAAGIEELGRRSGCTLYMTLLAGWQALLSCLSGLDGRPRQEDVVVGSPIAGRDRAEVEGLIGFFVNTLVMRNDLSGDPTFRELLARTREMALAAIAHRHVPFDRLVEELKPERSLALNPLFQVVFNFLETGAVEPVATEPAAALAVTPYRLEDETAQFDLVLVLGEGPDGLAGTLQYKTDLFESGTIDWIVEQYRSLLERAVAEPEVRLSELEAGLAEAAGRRRAAVERELGEASAQKFKTTRRRAVTSAGPPGEIDRR